MSAVKQIISWASSINWTPVAITAAGTVALAFLTLVLAAGTLFLWLATRRLVRGSEKTAERQLRAYIFSDHAKIIGFNTPHPLVIAAFKNSGQTPAYNVIVWVSCHIDAYPLGKNMSGQQTNPVLLGVTSVLVPLFKSPRHSAKI